MAFWLKGISKENIIQLLIPKNVLLYRIIEKLCVYIGESSKCIVRFCTSEQAGAGCVYACICPCVNVCKWGLFHHLWNKISVFMSSWENLLKRWLTARADGKYENEPNLTNFSWSGIMVKRTTSCIFCMQNNLRWKRSFPSLDSFHKCFLSLSVVDKICMSHLS